MKHVPKALRMARAKWIITQLKFTCHPHVYPRVERAILRKHSPDGATPTEVTDIWLQLTTHLSTPKKWKAELACLVDL